MVAKAAMIAKTREDKELINADSERLNRRDIIASEFGSLIGREAHKQHQRRRQREAMIANQS
jgi:hypothetical protein